MYGKFFASAFTGSMYGAGPDVFAVWAYVIANAVDSQVELNPRLLAGVIGMTPERAAAAIDYLCAPDAKSRSKVAEGRRMIREGEIAYSVVNHDAYRSIRSEEDRRAYNREKQREHRARVKGVRALVNDSQSLSSVSAQAVSSKQKQEAETNNTLALAGFCDRLPTKAQHLAWQMGAAQRNPEAWGASMGAILDGMDGTLTSPDALAVALTEMAATSAAPSPANVRAFLRRMKSDAARDVAGVSGGASRHDGLGQFLEKHGGTDVIGE